MDIDINFDKSLNIIYGNNAQGKTNILESIYIFSGYKSFRTNKDSDYINFDCNNANLNINYYRENRNKSAEIFFENNKKQIFINQIKQKSVSSLKGEFITVLFSPDNLNIVKGSPENRRRFLDNSISQIIPKYFFYLNKLEKIILQRTKLLKDIKYNKSLMDTLDIWDDALVEYCSYISMVRNKYINKLNIIAKDIYSQICKEKENFNIIYTPNYIQDYKNLPKEKKEWKDIYYQIIKNNQKEDILFQKTNYGAHRDDILIQINGNNTRYFASQGQQRSCVLALKLAECKLIKESINTMPIILLDDVMSELDENRQEFLLNNLNTGQIIITCCNLALYNSIKYGKIFNIDNGKLI